MRVRNASLYERMNIERIDSFVLNVKCIRILSGFYNSFFFCYYFQFLIIHILYVYECVNVNKHVHIYILLCLI